MRKGEIWDTAGPEGRTTRVLIVSADEWHTGADPQAVVIVRRHGMQEILPFAVLLHDQADDVSSGVIFMDSLHPVDTADLVECVGSVGGVTLSKVDHCLRKVFAL
jgi:mRNA-degrading endonuclease toxin of MazEF toxin-antitoxin module